MSERKNGGMCEAYGCPLAGSITADRGEGATWFCRFHYNAGRPDYDRITHKLRMNLELIHQIQTLSYRANDAYWLTHTNNEDGRSNAYAFARRPKTPDETHWDYLATLETELRRQVVSTSPAEQTEQQQAA